MDVSGRRHKGLLTGEDMANWEATYDKPATYDYGNYTVCKCGPWSQGPVLLQQLAILDGLGVGSMDPTGPDFVHTVVESAKLAFADREAYYGDPAFIDVPMTELLSPEYNERRRALIGKQASEKLIPGKIEGYLGSIDKAIDDRSGITAAASLGAGEPTVAKTGVSTGDTVHLDIIDRFGNMVSCTPSGGWLQSSPIIPNLGFCLSNRGQMFWLDKNSPACIGPKRRPRTTLSPSLALKDGSPYMVFGTPGGDQQDQWSLHLFLRHVHFGLNLQEAIDAPGFSTAHFPNSFYPRETDIGHLAVEGRFPKETIDELLKKGHKVSVDSDWSLGRMTAASMENLSLIHI